MVQKANAKWGEVEFISEVGVTTTIHHFMSKQKTVAPQTVAGQAALGGQQRTNNIGHGRVVAIGRANCNADELKNNEHQQPFDEINKLAREGQQGRDTDVRNEEHKDVVPPMPFRLPMRSRFLLSVPVASKAQVSTMRSESLNDLFTLKKGRRGKCAVQRAIESKFPRAESLDSILSTANGNKPPTKRCRDAQPSSSPTSVRRTTSSLSNHLNSSGPKHGPSPQATLMKLLLSQGHDAVKRSSMSMTDRYCRHSTDGEVASHDQDIIMAVRNRDVGLLRSFLREGRHKSLHSCNKFGESIIHIACRRGYTEVVHFLMKEAGVALRVRDDYGRTPLHDACWTCEPNFGLMEILLTEEPDMLLVSDKRGRAPLEYVRKEHWHSWIKFLEDRQDLLCQRGAGR